jgi:hypothetical protein
VGKAIAFEAEKRREKSIAGIDIELIEWQFELIAVQS